MSGGRKAARRLRGRLLVALAVNAALCADANCVKRRNGLLWCTCYGYALPNGGPPGDWSDAGPYAAVKRSKGIGSVCDDVWIYRPGRGAVDTTRKGPGKGKAASKPTSTPRCADELDVVRR